MSTPIAVQPDKLSKASTQIANDAADYKKLYEQLFKEVEKMGNAWKGTDNTAYAAQIEGFRQDFKAMYDLMMKYYEYLQLSAKTYETAQNEIATQAKRLTN